MTGQLKSENKKTFKSQDLKVLVLLKFNRKLHLAEKEASLNFEKHQ
jgi:hypothetical protein